MGVIDFTVQVGAHLCPWADSHMDPRTPHTHTHTHNTPLTVLHFVRPKKPQVWDLMELCLLADGAGAAGWEVITWAQPFWGKLPEPGTLLYF